MAVVEIYPVHHNRIGNMVSYVKNPAKTIESVFGYATKEEKVINKEIRYVSGINIADVDNAAKEFIDVQAAFNKSGKGVTAYHGWQSFPPDLDISPEEVHALGLFLMEELFGDRFQIIVTTHLDQKHLHNHFLINSVSFSDGKKFRGNKDTIKMVRARSDEMCLAMGLPIIEATSYKELSKGNYDFRKKYPKWRKALKEDIDAVIPLCRDLEDFKRRMEEKGYLLKSGKHFAVSPPGYMRGGKRAYVRLKSLEDDAYLLPGITERINENYIRSYGVITQGKVRRYRVKTRRPLPQLLRRYYRTLYAMGFLKKQPRRASAYKRLSLQKEARDINKKIRFIHDNGLSTAEGLRNKITELEDKEKSLTTERKGIYNARYRDKEPDEARLNEINEELKKIREDLHTAKSITVKEEKEEKKKERFIEQEERKEKVL